jgi:hypothetical protein
MRCSTGEMMRIHIHHTNRILYSHAMLDSAQDHAGNYAADKVR